MNNTVIAILVVILLVIGGYFIFMGDRTMEEQNAQNEQMSEEMNEENTDEEMDDMNEEEEMDLSGIHIMADGSVMLGDGTVLVDATVTEDNMILLSDGRIVEPALDMREGMGGSNEAHMELMGDHSDDEGDEDHDSDSSMEGDDSQM